MIGWLFFLAFALATFAAVWALARPGRAGLQGALEAGRRAVEADPDDVRALQALSLALYFAGHPDEGRATGEKALAINPNDPELLGELGLGLEHFALEPLVGLGVENEAVEHLALADAPGVALVEDDAREQHKSAREPTRRRRKHRGDGRQQQRDPERHEGIDESDGSVLEEDHGPRGIWADIGAQGARKVLKDG